MMTRDKQSITDIAYLAGLIDADGWIGIRRSKPGKRTVTAQYTGIVNVTNTHRPVLEWIQKNFGGFIFQRANPGKNWRDTCDWRLQGRNAADCCELIRDFLIVKQAKADIVIELLNKAPPKTNRRVPLEEMERRHNLWLQIRDMNSVGLVQPERLNSEAPEFYLSTG